jgi:putative transposase
MENCRKSGHTAYDLKYHIVWNTKYRKPALCGEIVERTSSLIREICRTNEVEIIKGHVSVSVPTYIYVSQLVQSLKGKKVLKDDDRI